MAVQGIFESNRGIVGNRKPDFASALIQIGATGSAPLLALTAGMKSNPAMNTIVHWFEESKIIGRFTLAAGYAANITDLQIDDASSVIPGTIFNIEETGEYIIVNTSDGATMIGVTRGFAGTTAAIITINDHITRVGNAHEESSGIPTPVVNQGSTRQNYTQIFRNAWAVSGTAKAVQFHTGSQLAKNRADAGMFHAEDMERSFWWGRKNIGVRNGNRFSTSDGIDPQIRQYGGVVETPAGGNVDQANFRDFLRRVFKNNIKGQPNERIAFAGDLTLQYLNEAARLDSTFRILTGETDFGMKFTSFICPFGTVKVMTHPLFVENPFYQGSLYVIHPGAIEMRPLRATFREEYDKNGLRIQGVDADQGVITTETCMTLAAPITCGIMEGITGAVAS